MTVLQSSGVTFSGHSTRYASSSKYTTVRVPTIEILKKGHLLNSNFERFYNKYIIVEDNFQLVLKRGFEERSSQQ